MTSPFAEYELTEVPFPDLLCSMAVGSRLVLNPGERTVVSRRRSETIYVDGSVLIDRGWRGTQNHGLECRDGVWRLDGLGQMNEVRVNGKRDVSVLQHQDRVEPARGLIFTFIVRDELEPLAAELATQTSVLRGNERVLSDWILERATMSAEAALRAITHFRYRLAHSGTL